MSYIGDGEIHALSKDYAYILNYIKEEDKLENTLLFQEKMREFLKKYADYIITFEKEKVIEILVEKFMPSIFGSTLSDDYQFVYKPAWMLGVLAQNAALSLKFKRSKNDNLELVENDR